MPLVNLAPFKVPRRAAAAQVTQAAVISAPVGGLNYRDPISNMQPTDALVLTNFIAKQQGVELRKGYKVNTETISHPVNSIFGFKSPTSSKLFAAADGDIYDVTTNPATLAVNNTGSTDNEWNTVMFSTPARSFLLAVSPGAGYWTYDSTDGWVKRTVTNLPANPTSVNVWKQRVWFTAKDDSNVYYMDAVNAVTGSVTSFPMGSLLRSGGSVAALINWTLDAGVGIDDHLVVVGTQGDVGVWAGTDPTSSTTFGLKGVWYVGPVPTKGTFYTPFGGDVMILSESGLVPMSRLVNGQFIEQQGGPASKIQEVLGPLIKRLRNSGYWNVFSVPAEDILVIQVPADGGTFRQFAMNVTTGAWSEFQGMPMRCSTMLDGTLYFGSADGVTYVGLHGNNDGALIDGAGGDSVVGEVQTAFQHFGTPANLKKFNMVKPLFISESQPQVKLRINVQFASIDVGGSPAPFTNDVAYWNSAVWNTATWVGSKTYQAWFGVAALGYYGAIRMKVRGLPGTVFTASTLMMEQGGLM